MPKAKGYCGLPPHSEEQQHRTAESLAASRRRKQAARRTGHADTPLAVQRWNRTYRLKQFGVDEAWFARQLEIQNYACAMCFEPFQPGEQIYIDHDHRCCGEKSACDKCRRGLLNLRCNVAVGYIERYGELALAYFAKTKTPGPVSQGVFASCRS